MEKARGRVRASGGAPAAEPRRAGVFPLRRPVGARVRGAAESPPRRATAAAAGASGAARLGAAGSVARLRQSRCAASGRRERRRRGKEGGEEGRGAERRVPCGVRVGGERVPQRPGPASPGLGRRGWVAPSLSGQEASAGHGRGSGRGRVSPYFGAGRVGRARHAPGTVCGSGRPLPAAGQARTSYSRQPPSPSSRGPGCSPAPGALPSERRGKAAAAPRVPFVSPRP